ncbi:Pkinase-domain-containing protein [Punctularia strigosozonata HHB-11173 SS5]|uniref:Pkinase-domain-containing protein n=1 Tax=Punctularia strigosozonata (strain HHB-11173) TaxID=741275 RepID=UPI0004416EF2|nr:Pkinase-domain-containing protein [Punctularia strigosozonata HHB-11173 SS5]EIN14529.1 Pkinase-domain-containing protein [Punctularia strigosozonata HHB-11173 SS5]
MFGHIAHKIGGKSKKLFGREPSPSSPATPTRRTPPSPPSSSSNVRSAAEAKSTQPIAPKDAPDVQQDATVGRTGGAVQEESSGSHSANTTSAMSSSQGLTTVPCQYRTGKTLGSGTYAIVKEAVHIKTGKYYACKVINKKLMEGREYMVRNEIAVLKRISSGHANIVTLHDYFETAHNLYLCFDLCTGGELFDRICAKGNYYEADAAALVRTILNAVKYIHDCGIVHRDLKPENLLFLTKAEDSNIMIADFGLSRIMTEDKFNLLTEICGTPGYMAPEIFKKVGHGKPVDIWAIGVITYFLLCGYTPFDRDTQQEESEAIMAGDYKFEPEEYWANVSPMAKDFVSYCLTVDPNDRPTAEQALAHGWLADEKPHFVPDPESPTGGPTDLLPNMQKAFNAKKTFRKAVLGMMAMKRMTMGAASHMTADEVHAINRNVAQYKEESEKEQIDSEQHVQRFESEEADSLKNQDDAASPNARAVSGDDSTYGSASGTEVSGMEKMSLDGKEKKA